VAFRGDSEWLQVWIQPRENDASAKVAHAKAAARSTKTKKVDRFISPPAVT